MGKLGGDSDLSARGKQYAKSLPRLIAASLGDSDQLTVSWWLTIHFLGIYGIPTVTYTYNSGQC